MVMCSVPPRRTHDLLVTLVADREDPVSLAGEPAGLVVTLVTRGHVASIAMRFRSAASSCTIGATPCAENTTVAPREPRRSLRRR